MSAKVAFTIVPVAEVAREDTIEQLEFMLERAKAGEISSVAIAAVGADGRYFRTSSDSDNLLSLLGAVTVLRRRIEDEIEDEIEELACG